MEQPTTVHNILLIFPHEQEAGLHKLKGLLGCVLSCFLVNQYRPRRGRSWQASRGCCREITAPASSWRRCCWLSLSSCIFPSTLLASKTSWWRCCSSSWDISAAWPERSEGLIKPSWEGGASSWGASWWGPGSNSCASKHVSGNYFCSTLMILKSIKTLEYQNFTKMNDQRVNIWS